MYDIVAEGGGRGLASGLRLEGRVCSMLTVMVGGDLNVATRVETVRVRIRVKVTVRVRVTFMVRVKVKV